MWRETETNKKIAFAAAITAILLILFIIVLVAVLLRAGWVNAARLVDGGRFIETHTACGPVRGTVDGADQFTFLGIPYAVPVLEADRFKHSRVPRNLGECFEGTFAAHNEDNETDALSGRCLRKMPDGVDGDEESHISSQLSMDIS